MIISRITITFVFLSTGFLFLSCQEPPQGPPEIKTVDSEKGQILESQLESKAVLDAKKITSTQEMPLPQRELKIKVIIDDSFYKKALKEIEGMQILTQLSGAELGIIGVSAQEVKRWDFSTPENLVIGIIQKVSELYEERFNISLRIIELERMSFEYEDTLLFDYQYMDLLNQQSCSGAEILIGFTSKILYPSEELFAPTNNNKRTIRGTAQSSTSRMFTTLSFWGWPPESFEKIVENIDHELTHLFDEKHGPDMQYDEKEYLEKAKEVIKQNRLKIFTCPEPESMAN